jgi:ATP-binding cassette, subfamily B (MDR/TAP), member 1
VRSERIVQAALDRVSQNRTTIVIAHRLSTIRKADNIIVLNKGKAIQQGSHEELMSQVDSVYWTLASAQQLSIDEENTDADEIGKEQRSMDILESEDTPSTTANNPKDETPGYTPKGFLRSFGTLIIEQKRRWKWYLLLSFGAIVAGGKCDNQAPRTHSHQLTQVFQQGVPPYKHICSQS